MGWDRQVHDAVGVVVVSGTMDWWRGFVGPTFVRLFACSFVRARGGRQRRRMLRDIEFKYLRLVKTGFSNGRDRIL
jgi:hypothetical protein